MLDVLVIGTGPAGLAIAATLCQRGLSVGSLAPTPLDTPWVNTYGIWCDELDALGLSDLLAHRWHDCVGYFGSQAKTLNRSYGLFDRDKLQTHFLNQCHSHQGGPGVQWIQGKAAAMSHSSSHSSGHSSGHSSSHSSSHGSGHATVTTQTGMTLETQLIIDASGHTPVLVQRSPIQTYTSQSRREKQGRGAIAYQAAYGVVGRFSAPPIQPGRFVLMDYRADHLSPEEQAGSPTFLYAMDLGNDLFFLEETSLAESPAVSFETLKHRLQKRLANQGIQLQTAHEEEYCLFPMNAAMPSFAQPVVGFGGAASMVHPATGYMVGALLRRAPSLADGVVKALEGSNATSEAIAHAAWSALWPSDRLRKYYIYLFGLETLMRFERTQLCCFFDTFFNLPQSQWAGFLADTLTPAELVSAMVNLFGKAPNSIRGGLMSSVAYDGQWLWRSLLS